MALETITKSGVLIADPSAHMAALIATMARSIGRRDIREATDSHKAMFELNRRAFDVLLIDDALTGADSIEFVRQLRANPACQNRYVPIIMMSSAPDAKRIADARDAGVTEFLRKPFAANHLQSRLTSIEANPRGFIEAPAFKGPDRRRKTTQFTGNDRREGTSPKPD